MDRTTVAATIERIAAYLELKGENQFKTRAYDTAYATVHRGVPTVLDGELRPAEEVARG